MSNTMLPSGISVRIREDLIDGASRVQTTLIIDPMVTLGGHRMTMADMGDIAYGKIDGGNAREEIIYWTGIIDNTTTMQLTGCVWGVNFHDLNNAVANYKRHTSGAKFEIKTDMHYITNEFRDNDDNIFNNPNPADFAANELKLGDGTTATDKVFTAQNGTATEPFMKYDKTLNKWVISNDGVNSYDPEDGGSGVTAGDGINIIGGEVSVNMDQLTNDPALDVTANRLTVVTDDTTLLKSGASGLYNDVITGAEQAAGCLTGGTSVGAESVFQILSGDNSSISLPGVSADAIGGVQYRGQTFISGPSGYLSSMQLNQQRGSAPTSSFYIDIYATTIFGKPTSSSLYNYTALASTLTTTADWYTYTPNLQLTPNTLYTVVMHYGGVGSGNDWVSWNYNGTAIAYLHGDRLTSSDSGATWAIGNYNNSLLATFSAGTNNTALKFNIDGTVYDNVSLDLLDYNISGCDYNGNKKSVASENGEARHVFFKPDGTKMYVVGYTSTKIIPYTLATAWDVTTATYDGAFYSVGTQETVPYGVSFKDDGTKMYVIGTANNRLFQYTLSTPWLVTSATYDTVNLLAQTQDGTTSGVFFGDGGMKVYICGDSTDYIYQYNLTSAWDLSTASYSNKRLSVGSIDIRQLSFNTTGDTVYFVGSALKLIYQYTLSIPWDISTGTNTNYSYNLYGTVGSSASVQGLFINYANRKVYVTDTQLDYVSEFNIKGSIPGYSADHIIQDISNTTDSVYGTNWKAQSFTTTNKSYINKIKLWINQTGSGSLGNFNVAIYNSTAGDLPTGSALQTSSITASTVPSAAGYVEFPFSLQLLPNTKYTFVCSTPSANSTNHIYLSRFAGNIYTGGQTSTSGDSGANWSATGYDTRFKIDASSPISDLAATIQKKIRATTSKTETVAYSTNKFVVTSSTANRNSQVLRFMAPTSGTDISPVNYLDLGANATETQGTGDENRLIKTDANGRLDDLYLDGVDGSNLINLLASKKLYLTTTPVTVGATIEETTIFTFTIPAGLLSTNNLIDINLSGIFGRATYTNTFKLKLGNTTLATMTMGTSSMNYYRTLRAILYSAGTTSSQKAEMFLNNETFSTAIGQPYANGTSTENSGNNLVLTITSQKDNTGAPDVVVNYGYAELIK